MLEDWNTRFRFTVTALSIGPKIKLQPSPWLFSEAEEPLKPSEWRGIGTIGAADVLVRANDVRRRLERAA